MQRRAILGVGGSSAAAALWLLGCSQSPATDAGAILPDAFTDLRDVGVATDCFGTPTPCASRSSAECMFDDGCTLAACEGSEVACSQHFEPISCNAAFGCTWTSGACQGEPIPCSGAGGQTGCVALGCTWNPTGAPCEGAPRACAELHGSECAATPGCGALDAGVDAGSTDAGRSPDDMGIDGSSAAPDAAHYDGGSACGYDFTASVFSPLSAACTPRCSAATRVAYDACADDQTCQINAIMADTTPGMTVARNGIVLASLLDCTGCVLTEQSWCVSTAGCAAEVYAALSCDPSTDCSAAQSALQGCYGAHASEITACENDPAGPLASCFAS